MRLITIIIELAFFIVALAIFVQTNKQVWEEIGKPAWNDTKSAIARKFRNTRLGMWYFNRKNGFKVLSEKEYLKIVSKQKERKIIFI